MGAWFVGGTRAAVAALVLASASGVAGLVAPGSSKEQPAVSTLPDDLVAFRKGLGRFRSGEDAALPELQACAERCARQGRADVRDVLAFFAALPPDARKEGLDAEANYTKLFLEVDAAGRQHMAPEDWQERRPEILTELQSIIANSIGKPDFTPAARSLSLRSTLFRQRVAEDDGIEESTRAKWIEDGIADANKSIELFERVGMLTPQLEARWALGWFDLALYRADSAEDRFRDVLARAGAVGQPEYESKALDGLIHMAQDAGDLHMTGVLLNEIARVRPPATNWDVTKRQAQYLLARDEPARAATFLAANKPVHDSDLPEWHVLMEGVLSRKGDLEAASAHANVLRASPAGMQAGTVEWLALTELDLREERFAEVLERLEGAEETPRLALRELADLARMRGHALLGLGRNADAESVLQEALEYGDSAEARLSVTRQGAATSSVMGETMGVETIALLAHARLELKDALGAAQAIENWQSRRLRTTLNAGKTTPDVSRTDVLAWAKAYELGFVTWVIGADTSVVVHVAQDGQCLGLPLNFGRKSVEEAVRRLRQAVVDSDSESTSALAKDIQHAMLPEQLLAGLHPREGDRLLACLHGPLQDLPLDLLPFFSTTGKSSVVSVVLPGLLEHVPGQAVEPNAADVWSILGDPVDSEASTLLPGAREELNQVAALHAGSRIQSRGSFTGRALTEALQANRRVHIATHLLANSHTTTSIDDRLTYGALALSSGERFGIDDIRRAHPCLPLAVLDACETGGGQFVDAQAANGVARAFLESGTRNLLVTLWPVRDEAAQGYAIAFHRALNAGASPSRAAASARDALRASGAPSADWAAFRLLGRD